MQKSIREKNKIILISIYLFLLIVFNNYYLKINQIDIFHSRQYLNYINVAYAFDNNYEYITHVSMKSIMLHQEPTTFIKFYILVPNINTNRKNVINKIKIEHKNCNITFFEMGQQFKNYNIPLNIWSTAIYYRIKLQELLPNENKILYLDSDTLIYKDLSKIYNYEIGNNYYIGMLENRRKTYFKKYNASFNTYINSGVLLCNLKELRNANITNKFIDFYQTFKNKVNYPLNDGVNYVSNGKIGYFDPEYVVIAFCNEKESFNYYDKMNIKVDKIKVVKSYKDPYIYHYIIHRKPWKGFAYINSQVCVDPFIRFYELAKKTSYYHEILKNFPIKYKNNSAKLI